jgi:CubicO group peptidase (beta-lactamase class C family)
MNASRRTWSAALFALLLFPVLSWAQSLGYASNPEDVGFSRERLGRIADTINTDIAKGIIPGATLLIARDGKIAYYESFGWLDAQSKTPMPKEAIFRIYSMSKPITSVAAMILVEQGKLLLSDPFQKYIPAFANMKVAVQKPGTPEVDLVPQRALEAELLHRALQFVGSLRRILHRQMREAGITLGVFLYFRG